MTISCLVVITSLFFLSQGNHSALGVRLALRQEIKVAGKVPANFFKLH